MAALAALAVLSGQPGMTASSCGKLAEQSYRQKAELPRGVVEAIGVDIAEKGQAYQRGDVMQPGLPLYRFVSATRSGCRIRINYEQGGFAHRWGTFSLFHIAGAWRVTGTR
ncbi:hypothetical protein ASE00_06190 [Sphingomonas sp. Root710]|nr:hypothetical protein ASE00_06190 [Sphingomonas sp. Root710]